MPKNLDHATEYTKRSFEPLKYNFPSILHSHTILPIYVTAEQNSVHKASNTEEYYSNNAIWEANILGDKHYHGKVVKLNSFFLFEWFPRSPGLYFTSSGRQARDDARTRIIGTKGGAVVYDPYGKQSMLDGGVGNVRLKPVHIHNRDWMFLSASDNGVCHQGFPIALPVELYRTCIDEIKVRGAATRTLIGELKFVPKEIEDAFVGYTEVKKFYLEVHEIKLAEQHKSRTFAELEVSVAISFEGTVDGEDGVYASYATFDPASKNELNSVVQWMENEYLSSYNGKVLTDFDQQENHFKDARFSLEKVMKLELPTRAFHEARGGVYIGYVENLVAFQKHIKSNYDISGGKIGIVGDNASVGEVYHGRRSDQSLTEPVAKARRRWWPIRRE